MESLTIGQVAKQATVHIETLRYYERRGLVARPRRSTASYRLYPAETVRHVRFVKRAPLCYCFGHTRRSIADQITATGRSSAFAAVTHKVKAGHCACEVKNPSGRCCLGDVRSYERDVAQERTGTRAPVRGNAVTESSG